MPSLNRRELLQMLGATASVAGLSACTREPAEEILPWVRMPERRVPGEPAQYASTLSRDGYGQGVIVRTHAGRPTKVEGNPGHPGSLGATDPQAQAAVLELYDPDRSRTPIRAGAREATLADFDRELEVRLDRHRQRGGEGLCLLTGSVTSPAAVAQLERMQQSMPAVRWYRHDALARDEVYAGARLAFGAAVETIYRPDRARVVLSLDADLVGTLPGSLAYARQLVSGRRPTPGDPSMNRLYVLESAPTQTGAIADHRHALRAGDVYGMARALAVRLGVLPQGERADIPVAEKWLDAAVRDLEAHRGAGIIVPGDHLPAAVHALAHAMNERLHNAGRTVLHLDPVPAGAGSENATLASLTDSMRAGSVETLVMLGVNPVYTAPADIGFAGALTELEYSVHLGLYADETAALSRWHLPEAHALECWGDLRAYDGTPSLVQPLIAPLYGGLAALDVLARLNGRKETAHGLLQEFWRPQAGSDFESFWREALETGVVPADTHGRVNRTVQAGLERRLPAPGPVDALELQFRPDPTVRDGSHANNAWLQELPKPLLGLVWDNAILAGPQTAARHGVVDGDLVRISHGGREIEGPVIVASGHAEGSVTLMLGYGRERAGRIGNGNGYDAYALRSSTAPWVADGAALEATGRRAQLARVQQHHGTEDREPVRESALHEIGALAEEGGGGGHHESLYPGHEGSRYQWGMAIDLNACIGCRSCTIACQAENNIPVVGKQEVARGREMHWIRVDHYEKGSGEERRTYFQPVPCMHCEHAPCEYVCPTAAAVHDSEGLNVQVYNRCIGTRDCSQNCPYKVRRFNWLDYNGYESGRFRKLATPAPQRNPSVTVRSRGVMEKCTYCVQRISAARIEAKKDDRPIADGEVVTACQAVCPADAIRFGDVSDPSTAVSRWKADGRNYVLLGHLNTRPRTSYLARVRNPNPSALGDDDDGR
ncbi:MAG TPA: 4Fe-4S dicluster domain-containing protein [Woeseiaceae bacterium]|nr:4Fe-4S dicluster domain-containing protein [Woeseiaceae bacterium]